ncbi:MAG: hypothetical protein PVH93_03315 [Nitrosopumilaceae archaeon]
MTDLDIFKNLNSTEWMTLILAYPFNASAIDDDVLDHKSQKLKTNHVSCGRRACDEKNDRAHEHKRQIKLINKTLYHSHK